MNYLEVKDNKLAFKQEALEQYKNLLRAKRELDEIDKKIKEEIKKEMEKTNTIKVVIDDLLEATIVGEHTRKSIDTKKIKEEIPEIAEMYEKETKVKSSLRLKVL